MDENLQCAGQWIFWKTQQCNQRNHKASEILEAYGQSIETLREQWHLQVAAQTQPLPSKLSSSLLSESKIVVGQSKTKGNSAIQEAKRLRVSQDIIRSRIHRLEDIMANPTSAEYEVVIAEAYLKRDQICLDKIMDEVRSKERALGIDGWRALDRLMNDPYINDRMNAQALKIHICQRLTSHKFECDRIERHLHQQINGNLLFKEIPSLTYFRFWTLTSVAYRGCSETTQCEYPGACLKIQQTSWSPHPTYWWA